LNTETSNAARAIDVAIVTYRSAPHIEACLETLRGDGELIMDVVVIDNDSPDQTPELVRERFPQVRLVEAGRNLGFGRAVNRVAQCLRSPYLLVLNADVRVERETISRLLDVLTKHSEVGVIGPTLLQEDGTIDHACRRSFPTVFGALGHFTGLGRRERAPHRLSQYRAPTVSGGGVDAINGAFMLFRRKAFDAVGGFDERYWMYMEDLDLCWRLRQAGWVTWYEPSVSAVHVKAGSSGRLRSPRLNAAFHYGMFRFYRTHYAPTRARAVNATVYAGIGAKLAVSLLRTELRRLAART
jgi:N-acetylglucosaminyl-diphospho-decaprenol L-rhamnosyltransferase